MNVVIVKKEGWKVAGGKEVFYMVQVYVPVVQGCDCLRAQLAVLYLLYL
jgi:hypothetical protein